jgi:hypothetical protein
VIERERETEEADWDLKNRGNETEERRKSPQQQSAEIRFRRIYSFTVFLLKERKNTQREHAHIGSHLSPAQLQRKPSKEVATLSFGP